ncbi:MAG: DUF4349 domain-containing protein [Phenylobacterium sp.]
MRRFLPLLLISSLALCGCKAKLTADRTDAAQDAAAAASDGSAAAPEAGSAPAPPGVAPMLAYTYGYTLQVPAGRVAALMQRHAQACAAAGPTVCQMTSSQTSNTDGDIYAELILRAAPVWLTRFRAGLEADARGAGGRLVSSEVTSEDLTRSIVDTEARLRASTALRDRLQGLLDSRPGKLSDLLDTEKELARVQGELDAAQSELQVMRGRVQMSEVHLHYRAAGRPLTGQTTAPLGQAFNSFFGVMAATVAVLVYAVAVLVPLSIVVVPIVWLIVRARRRRREKAQKDA